MKAGMALCLPFHCQTLQAPYYVFFFSCVLGFTADVFVNTAYCAIVGSAIQMLRGGKILFTALLSVVVLKRRVPVFQIIGIGLVLVGLMLVGASTQLHPMVRPLIAETDSRWFSMNSKNWMALCCCMTSEICPALLWVYQEMVIHDYGIPPLQLVGVEGVIGVCMGSAVIIIAHNIQMEDLVAPLYQASMSVDVQMSVAALLMSMAIFNFSGVSVTKYGSAVTRSIVDASRCVIIWAVELWYGWYAFSPIQLCGFILLVVGAGVHNGIVSLPFGLSQHESAMELNEGTPLKSAKLKMDQSRSARSSVV